MSHETARENIRTLDLLEIRPTDHVLEVGFGHGRTVARAAALASEGRVAGVEVSARMVEMANGHNQEAVRAGRVELQCTDGTRIPYGDATFDKAYSVHTIYFWEDAEARIRELCRVLKPHGRLVLTFRHGERFVADLPGSIYRHRSCDEVAALLEGAGFSALDVHDSPPTYFIVAERRSQPGV